MTTFGRRPNEAREVLRVARGQGFASEYAPSLAEERNAWTGEGNAQDAARHNLQSRL